MIKTCASCDFDGAIRQTEEYLIQLKKERAGAEEAIKIVQDMLHGEVHENHLALKRKEVSRYLDISVDALRNWEMNGLMTVKRNEKIKFINPPVYHQPFHWWYSFVITEKRMQEGL